MSNEQLYQAYHEIKLSGTNLITTAKYKQMQIPKYMLHVNTCYIHWLLVIENLKRLQSLCKRLIFNLTKLFLDGLHGYTCQMLNYPGYKKLLYMRYIDTSS